MKNIEKNDSVYSFVLEKINYYNEELDEMNLVNVFDKTIKYLESPEDYFTKNDIIELFTKDEQKVIIEFNKLDNFKDIMYIYEKINNINKTEILLNKFDDYIENNNLDYDFYNSLILFISTITDIEIIKKYGIIILEYKPNYDIYMKMKPLCNETELQKIVDNIKTDYINDENFDILYDYKLYDKLYELISKKSYRESKIIYCDKLKDHIPVKICVLLQEYIEEILKLGSADYYSHSIQFLKIYKKIVSDNDFTLFTKDLLKTHSRKIKFKGLFKDEFY